MTDAGGSGRGPPRSSCARSARATCARSSACSPRACSRPACAASAPSRRCSSSTADWQAGAGALADARAARRPALHDRARGLPARGEPRPAALRRRRLRADGGAARRAARRGREPSPTSSASTSVLPGILPTMRKTDLGLDEHGAEARYHALNTAISDLRGGDVRLLHQGPRRAAHQARLGDARGVQRELPGPPAGRRRRVRAPLQHRAGARRPGARRRDQLADAVRPPAVGRDAHRAVPAGGRHAPADATTCATSSRASASATAGCRARSSRSTARTSRASRRCCPTSTKDPLEALARRGPAAQGAAPAQRHDLPLEPRLLRDHRRQAAPAHREPRDARRADDARRDRERRASGSA